MGTRETRDAARVADLIARRGETFTLHGEDAGTIRAITDSDYQRIAAKVGVESIEKVQDKGGRVQMLYLSPADARLIPKGTSLTDSKGVRWSCEPGRELSPDDTDMMVSLFATAGSAE